MNLQNAAMKGAENANSVKPSAAENLVNRTQANIINNLQNQYMPMNQLRMNTLASIDRSLYIKNLMNLPRNMVDLLVVIQQHPTGLIRNPNKKNPNINKNSPQDKAPLNNNPQGNPNINADKPVHEKITQVRFFQRFKNVKPLRYFPAPNNHKNINLPQHNRGEFVQKQIQQSFQHFRLTSNNHIINRFSFTQLRNLNLNHHLQGAKMFNPPHARPAAHPHNHAVSQNHVGPQNAASSQNQAAQINIQNQLNQVQTQNLAALLKSLSSQDKANMLQKNIDLNDVSYLIQQNGKEAVNKLIVTMSNVSKQGLGDMSQINDTIKVISQSMAGLNDANSAVILKNLMLLYLPWLPLQEGVGFKLEIENSLPQKDESDSSLTIQISTRNFGNVSALVTLMTAASVDVFITCTPEFPKKNLLERLQIESDEHSMTANFDIEEKKPLSDYVQGEPQAKVNLANTTVLNPYLLLMAHSIIKHTIDIDNLTTLGIDPSTAVG